MRKRFRIESSSISKDCSAGQGMYGVQTPRKFLQMLLAVNFLLEGETDPHFFHVWCNCLASETWTEPFDVCLERMQDDWFRARGLPADDPKIVQPVLEHRAQWAGKKVVPPRPRKRANCRDQDQRPCRAGCFLYSVFDEHGHSIEGRTGVVLVPGVQ